MRLIGFKRILGMLLLAVMLAFSFFYNNYIVSPAIDKQEKELAKNKAEVAEMTNTIDDLVRGIELFEEQRSEFEKLGEYKFFDPQDRVEAGRRISKMQEESRLMSAKYSLKAAETEDNEIAAKAGHKVLVTKINFRLEAIEDKDIYEFIYLLNYGFPGHIAISKLNVERKTEVTQPLLRQIGTGQVSLQPLVSAGLDVEWRTMVPDTSLQVVIEDDQVELAY